MSTSSRKLDETRLAEEIVGVLPAESIVRICSEDRDSVRFAIRDESLKIRAVILSRTSLSRLLSDPARSTKVEYLHRELLASAERRAEFRYPRGGHGHVKQVAPPSMPLASVR